MEMSRRWPIEAVVVAVGAPLAQAESTVSVLARHLPVELDAAPCAWCEDQWPCRSFTKAVDSAEAMKLNLADLIPTGFHRRLWPPQP